MNEIFEFIKPLNWETVLGMFIVCWYFTRDIKIELKETAKRTDRLYEMFIDLLKEKK